MYVYVSVYIHVYVYVYVYVHVYVHVYAYVYAAKIYMDYSFAYVQHVAQAQHSDGWVGWIQTIEVAKACLLNLLKLSA